MKKDNFTIMASSPEMDFYERCAQIFARRYFWAKTTSDGSPGCAVWQHGVAAAEVLRKLLMLRPDLQSLLPDGVVSLAAVHDVGKISPGFQTKCIRWQGPDGMATDDDLRRWALFYESNHAKSSWELLRRYYRECTSGKAGRFWAACAGAHHGFPVDQIVSNKESIPEDWWTDSKQLIDVFVDFYGSLPLKKQSETIRRVVSGAIIVSDWIASHEDFFTSDRLVYDYRGKAEEALKKIGWQDLNGLKNELPWESVFSHCACPRPLQNYMWKLPAAQGVYVIEDAMGGGKTEAALALAYHLLGAGTAHGIYFALPTQTTSNRIFYRLKSFVEACGFEVNQASLRLAHGSSWMLHESLYLDQLRNNADASSIDMRNWFSSAKRALLTPFGVGTIDQALMGVVAVKHRDVRAFALAGKVVILDEVHSYDFYTGSLISVLVSQLRESGASIIILSATLTQARVRELLNLSANEPLSDSYPLVTAQVQGSVHQQSFDAAEQKAIKISLTEQTIEDVAEHAYERAQKGGCVLWIRNTVKDAQEAYRILKNVACEGGPEIALLHARFPYWRREELERKWIDCLGSSSTLRPQGCVLVATQVVEQSVDIDADYLITDFAPTDMLLQRAGRLWRHARQNRPFVRAEMLVAVPSGVREAIEWDDLKKFMESFGATAKVYAPYVLLKTWNVWYGKISLNLPADIRNMIEKTYDDSLGASSKIGIQTYSDMQQKAAFLRSQVSMNQSFAAGVGKDEGGAFTRFGAIESAQVLLLKSRPVCRGDGGCTYEPLVGPVITVYPHQWRFETAKAIHENSVQIPKWQIGKLMPDENLTHYGYKGVYPFFILENGLLMYYSGEDSNLGWNLQLGIYSLPGKVKKDDELEFMY